MDIIYKYKSGWVVRVKDIVGFEILPLEKSQEVIYNRIKAMERIIEDLSKDVKNAVVADALNSELIKRKVGYYFDKAMLDLGYKYLIICYSEKGSVFSLPCYNCNESKIEETLTGKIRRIVISEENGIVDVIKD